MLVIYFMGIIEFLKTDAHVKQRVFSPSKIKQNLAACDSL